MQNRKIPFYTFLLLSIICFTVAVLIEKRVSLFQPSEETEIQKFQEQIIFKEKRLQAIVDALSSKANQRNYKQKLTADINYFHNLLESDGFALLIYENDSLQFWSDNSIPVENFLKHSCFIYLRVSSFNGNF